MNVFGELVLTLSRLLDLSPNGYLGHGERVGFVAWLLASECLPEQAEEVFYAGLIHDIGALPAPHHITHYTSFEAQLAEPVVRRHPEAGAQLVRRLPSSHGIADLVLEHHEYWDGTGYPRGTQGDEIALGAQLIRIADYFDLRLRQLGQPTRPSLSAVFDGEGANRQFTSELQHRLEDILAGDEAKEQVCSDIKLGTLVDQLVATMPPRAVGAPPNETLYMEGTSLRDGRRTEDVLWLFAEIIDSRHTYTEGHSQRVARYCDEVSLAMGLLPEVVRDFRWAALLHDAGMVAVPRHVLDAPRGLSEQERGLVRAHPVRSKLVVEQVSCLRHLAPLVAYHQAHYNGEGYPDNIAGADIPLGARVIAVCDAFDAMTSPRPYQGMRTAAEAVRVLQQNAGTQFDPAVVEVASAVFAPQAVTIASHSG